MRTSLALIIVASSLAVAGCSSKGLKDIRSTGSGPDEFGILPVKPLTAPKDYQVLPAPTPGGSNLTDPTPTTDAMLALGASSSALQSASVPAAEQSLVTAASRYGVPPNTRASLAQEDAKFRKRQGRMTRIRLFPVDRYEQAYRGQSIDPYQQADGFRRAGVPTPSAPPNGE